jgi:hypothetical protein
MSDILTHEGYRLYWHDEAQTIIVLEVRARWTWGDAKVSLDSLNAKLATIPAHVSTFSIVHFLPGVASLPDGINVTSIRDLVLDDTEYEKLVIFVGSYGLAINVLKLAVRVYNLPRDFSRYHFVDTFADALALIDEYRQKHQPAAADA